MNATRQGTNRTKLAQRRRPDMGTKGYVIAQLNIIPPTKEDERRAMRTVAVSVPKDEVRSVLGMLGLA